MAKILSGLITTAMVLVALVVLLATGVTDRAAKEQERRHREEIHQVKLAAIQEATRLQIERERTLQPVKTAALGLGIMGGTFTALGAGYYIVASLRKRSWLIHADGKGLFPQVRVTVGDATLIHDPNRSPVATTAYLPAPDGGVTVVPILPDKLMEATRQAVTQGAAVQLTAAAVHKGPALTDDAQNVARRFLPLEEKPTVRVLASEVAGVEKLLSDEGGEGDDEP